MLGELVSINCLVATALEVLLRGDTARFADELPIPPPLAPKDGTYSDPARAGGGFAQTQLTHTIGMFLYVTGLAPAEVYARTQSRGLDLELAVDAVFTLEDGTLGTLAGTGTIAAPQRQTHELRYFGSEAYAVQDILAGEVTLVSANGDEETVGPTRRSEPLASRAPARAFADLIAGNGQNYAPGDVAARVVDFIAALYRSAESGRRRDDPTARVGWRSEQRDCEPPAGMGTATPRLRDAGADRARGPARRAGVGAAGRVGGRGATAAPRGCQ